MARFMKILMKSWWGWSHKFHAWQTYNCYKFRYGQFTLLIAKTSRVDNVAKIETCKFINTTIYLKYNQELTRIKQSNKGKFVSASDLHSPHLHYNYNNLWYFCLFVNTPGKQGLFVKKKTSGTFVTENECVLITE